MSMFVTFDNAPPTVFSRDVGTSLADVFLLTSRLKAAKAKATAVKTLPSGEDSSSEESSDEDEVQVVQNKLAKTTLSGEQCPSPTATRKPQASATTTTTTTPNRAPVLPRSTPVPPKSRDSNKK